MTRLETALAGIRRWDERHTLRLNRALDYPSVHALFLAASRAGNGIAWYALMLAMLLADPRGAAGAVLHMAAVGLAGTLAYTLLKRGTHRPRPCEVHAHIRAGDVPLDRFSFPSGHTLHATAFTIVALAYQPGLAPLVVPFALLVAASRVVLGLHYPSDVLAGAAIGAAIAAASFAAL
ncbi:MAG: phosphatase PAP2 family protein [Burkholderiales bacterium]|nr:phosphatase PAP2 family protein [Burkholderiales bacterium]